jgi:microcin C transport system substrate-binding protein
MKKKILFILFLFLHLNTDANSEEYEHGIAMHGNLKYSKNFKNFEYANPNAPKKGKIKLASIGTFDNLNPYILKGVAAWQMSYLFETLMKSSSDEAFSQYGLLAESIKVPKDRSWVSFKIREEAEFSDKTPVTSDDVVFSFKIITTKGHPFYKNYYNQVDKVIKINRKEVKFLFKGERNRELPLIIGYQLPIFSKNYWKNKSFEKTTMVPPIGSGPYLVSKVVPGRSITLKKNKEYWGKNINVNIGRYNIEEIHTDFYRDETVAMEAFKSSAFDFKLENSSKNWATSYDFKAVNNGQVIVEEIPYERPSGMQGFAFNLRKPIFKNRNVRKALSYAFDFEWSNKNLFYGAYKRTKSFFDNSELSSQELPNKKELKILENYKGQIPNEVFNEIYSPPTTAGNQNTLRGNLRIARRILKEEGWIIKNDILINKETREPLKFEILLRSPLFERIVLPLKRNYKKLGIDVSIRTVQDDSQYQKRLEEFDFDMVVSNFGSIISPGNEQKNWWGSKAADQKGSMNISGVKNPVLDEIIDKLIESESRDDLIVYSRILDRIVLFNHYLIPQFHIDHYRVAYWNKFSRPAISPKYDLGFDFWWYDQDKERKLGKPDIDENNMHDNGYKKYFFPLILFLLLVLYRYWKKKKNV